MISYIINHRGDNGKRLENLEILINFISQIKSIEVIIVEQDDKSKLQNFGFVKKCKHIFVKNSGLFNRSWGLNVGYRHSKFDNLMFADNDILIPEKNIIESIQKLKIYPVVKPYDNFIDLTPKESQQVKNKTISLNNINRSGRGGTNICSGNIILTKTAFEVIGGWDERFRGWGGEDDCLAHYKIPLLLGNDKSIKISGHGYHLWHERTINDTHKQEHYQKNLDILKWYSTATKDEIINTINLKEIGLENKYENE